MWFSFFLIIKCLYFNDIVTLPFASSFVEVFDLFCTQLYLVTIIRSHVKNEMWFSLKLKLFDFWKKIKKIKWHSTDREKLIAIHSEEELKSFLIFVFWMLSFKPTFSLSSFTLIKRLFSSFLLSAIGWCLLHIWGYWCFVY